MLLRVHRFGKSKNRSEKAQESLLRGPPGNGDDLPVDPPAVRGRQERDDARHVLGLGAAPERAVVGHEPLDLVGGEVGRGAGDVVPGVGVEHVALDAAGRDAVDGDAAAPKVGGHGLDEPDDGHLAPVVERVVLDALEPGGDGGHEDDAAVVLHVLEGGLADEELRARVEREDVVELLLGDLLGDVPGLGARVAHDDVDAAHGRLGLGEEPLDLGDLADVGLDRDGAGAVVEPFDDAADLLGGGLGGDVVDDDAGAAFAHLDGAAAADAAAGAGDERDLAVQAGGGDGDGHCGALAGLSDLSLMSASCAAMGNWFLLL